MNKALSVISNLLRMSGLLVSEANAENTMLVYGTWQPVALTFRKLGYSKDYQNADLTVVKKLDSVIHICNIKDTVTVVTDYSNQVTEFHSCFTSIVHSLVALYRLKNFTTLARSTMQLFIPTLCALQ